MHPLCRRCRPLSHSSYTIRTTDGYDPKAAGLSSALFDPFRTGGKLSTRRVRRQWTRSPNACATLSPDDLGLVTGGPKSIDFGTISVFTQVTRNASR